MTVRPLQGGVRLPCKAMHIKNVDTLGFPTVQRDWKNSTVAPSYPPRTSGNPLLKKNFFVIFLTNLQRMTVQPLPAGVGLPGTTMHIQKVDTLGFPTVPTDWKNSTLAPSYPPNTFTSPIVSLWSVWHLGSLRRCRVHTLPFSISSRRP